MCPDYPAAPKMGRIKPKDFQVPRTPDRWALSMLRVNEELQQEVKSVREMIVYLHGLLQASQQEVARLRHVEEDQELCEWL